jgi:hypothetical protein
MCQLTEMGQRQRTRWLCNPQPKAESEIRQRVVHFPTNTTEQINLATMMLDLARKHNFERNMAGAAQNIGPILLQNFPSLQRSPDAETVKRWIKREMQWHQDEAGKTFTAEVITTGNGPVGVGSDERSRARRARSSL